MQVNDRFPILSSIAKILQVFGWIVVAIGGLMILTISLPELVKCLDSNSGHSWRLPDWMQLFSFGGVALIGFITIAASEVIGVLFAIEANTRKKIEEKNGDQPV
jgi:hypothetical protein